MGQKLDPCHSMDIEKSLLAVEPPGFIARWHAYPGPCPEVARVLGITAH